MSVISQGDTDNNVEEVAGSTGPTVPDPSAVYAPPEDSGGTFYAWSRFQVAKDEESGHVTGWLVEGDEVSKSILGVEDEEWDDLVKEGVVRTSKYPVPKGSPDSPNEHYRRQMAIAAGEEIEE